jgi:hypothetical protein
MKAGSNIFIQKQNKSMELHHSAPPKKKKARTIPLAEEIIGTVFWEA